MLLGDIWRVSADGNQVKDYVGKMPGSAMLSAVYIGTREDPSFSGPTRN